MAGSKLPKEFLNQRNIVSLDIFTRDKYGLEYSLCDFDSTLDKRALVEDVDDLLNFVAEGKDEFAYLPLALNQVYHRCLAFKKYQHRLELLLSNFDTGVKSVTLSSADDYILVEAMKSVCKVRNIKYKVLNYKFNPVVSRFQYSDLIDIPKKRELDFLNFPILFAFWSRLVNNTNVICMNYPNLAKLKLPKFSLSYFSIVSKLISRLSYKNTRHDLTSHIARNSIFFDSILEVVLGKLDDYHHAKIFTNEVCCFLEDYPLEDLDKIVDRIAKFLKTTGANHIVTHDSLAASARLISLIMHKLKGYVSYLPHGILMYDKTYLGYWPYKPDSILAWTKDAEKKYLSLNNNTIFTGHPSIHREDKDIDFRPDFLPLSSSNKILVVLSSGDFDYPDEFIRDAITLNKLLVDKFSIYADFKYRSSDTADFYRGLSEELGIAINYLDSNVALETIYKSYNLVIVCMFSTVILEVIESGVPLIIYSRQQLDLDLIDQQKLPVFNSIVKLGEFLGHGDYKKYCVYQDLVRENLNIFNSKDFISQLIKSNSNEGF